MMSEGYCMYICYVFLTFHNLISEVSDVITNLMCIYWFVDWLG